MSVFSKAVGDKSTKTLGPRHDQVNGLLDKGCSFEGKLTFDGTVQINGEFRGEIYSDGTLIIGADAQLNAGIFVDTLVVYGKVEGRIESRTRVEMRGTAMVLADVTTRHLSVEDGVIFQGMCRMESPATGSRQGTPALAPVVVDEEDNNVLVM